MTIFNNRNQITLNRSRAYLDDPMWLLNEACKNATGYDLPNGFFNDDWKYKLEDGKKKGVRDPLPLLTNPFATINYYGLDTKIMRINLFEELKVVFGRQLLFYPVHYQFPIYKAFALFLHDINREDVKASYHQAGSHNAIQPTYLDWYYSWEKELQEYIYEDETSKLYFPVSEVMRNRVVDFARHYFNNAFLMTDKEISGSVSQLPDFIPKCLWRHPLECSAKRYQLDAQHTEIQYDSLEPKLDPIDNFELSNLDTLFIASTFSDYDTRMAFKYLYNLGKRGKSSTELEGHQFIANDKVRDIMKKIKERTSIHRPARFEYRPPTSCWMGLNQFCYYSKKNNYCQNCNVKVAKFNWIEAFWTTGTRSYTGEIREIGDWFKDKTDNRKNAWEYVKKHSGLLGEYEDYYKHRDYQQHHKKNIADEIMKVMN